MKSFPYFGYFLLVKLKFFRHHLRVKTMCFFLRFTSSDLWHNVDWQIVWVEHAASSFIVVEEEFTTLKMEAQRLSETPVTIYPVFPPTPLRCYRLVTCNLCMSFRIRDQFSHPYKVTMKCSDFTHHLILPQWWNQRGNMVVLCIYIYIYIYLFMPRNGK